MRAALVAAAGLALALLAGCGGDDASRAIETSTVVQTVTQQAQSDPATTTSSKRAAPAPKPPKARRVTKLTAFTSPSRNIGCYIDRKSVRCDIAKRSWKPPRRPRSCELDYGQGIGLSAGGKPAFVCAGDTALNRETKLAYGTAIQAGVLRCDSKTAGITCKDTKAGRGFTLSREGYTLR